MRACKPNPGENEREFVRRIYSYDPLTGILSRRVCIGGGSAPGTPLGSRSAKGYLRTEYVGRQMQVHRLIWFHQMGEWPPQQIDHVNGSKSDNRWENLRLASPSQNKMNSGVRKDSLTGIKGVTIDSRCCNKKFRAHIAANGKRIWLGYFYSIEEALEARITAAKTLHGSFAKEYVS